MHINYLENNKHFSCDMIQCIKNGKWHFIEIVIQFFSLSTYTTNINDIQHVGLVTLVQIKLHKVRSDAFRPAKLDAAYFSAATTAKK